MKYAFSFFICFNLWAKPIRILYEIQSKDALIVRDILINQYQVPIELIALEKSFLGCQKEKQQALLELCLEKNGELLVLSANRKFINESLKVFQE